MKLSYITLDELGQVTCMDENGNELFLQLPITPDSQNYINREPLDNETAKDYQKIIDEYFGKGDRTLARLCYAGGKEYKNYTKENVVYTTDTGEEFVESDAGQYYNVEHYVKIDNHNRFAILVLSQAILSHGQLGN